VQARRGAVVALVDGALEHRLFVTASTQREQMQCWEEGAWYSLYRQALEQFQPDMVFYYGGKPFDFLIAAEARACGIPAVFYLANGNYTQTRFCRDVDLLLTDSQATADLYARRLGVAPVPVGAFIEPARVVAQQHSRERVLFVNPRPEKGAVIVVRLAMLLEKRRPDIVFEVVESRGSWAEMVHRVSTALGTPREVLANVVVTPITEDMRPVYGRARLLLAPSLWWESAGRVVAEAMLNGIPAIVTDNGGMPEMMRDGGIVLKLDASFHEDHHRLPPDGALESVVRKIEALFDDEAQYCTLSQRALQVGQQHHGLQVSTRRLLQALQPLVRAPQEKQTPGHLSSIGKEST
jgi:glycosyltransferase involved in cell wall biosynthesis